MENKVEQPSLKTGNTVASLAAEVMTSDENVTADVEQQQLCVEESPAQPINGDNNKEDALAFIKELKSGKKMFVDNAKANGIHFALAESTNRAIRPKHVAELVASVKRIKSFLQPIKVLTAEDYFSYYPERKLTVDGVEINRDSPLCSVTLTNLDGQHRYASYEQLESEMEKCKSTLECEYIELHNDMTPDQWMVESNTNNATWDSKDRRHHILAILPDEETNLSVVNEWQTKYKMGERLAFAILQLQDCYKKSEYVKFMEDKSQTLSAVLKGSSDNIKRGRDILHAFEIGFRHYPKMLKNMAAVNLAIEKYTQASDQNKVQVREDIILFFKSLSKQIAMNANFESSIANKTEILRAEWRNFGFKLMDPSSRELLKQMAQEAEGEWAELEKKRDKEAKEAEVKRLATKRKAAISKPAKTKSKSKTKK